jgi:hypothetical protein
MILLKRGFKGLKVYIAADGHRTVGYAKDLHSGRRNNLPFSRTSEELLLSYTQYF